jgi:hypothetical protein
MKWSYRRYAVGESRICPSGIVSRPEAKVRVSGSLGETYLRVLLDTGADHTVLPYSIAADIGAELFEDELDVAKGVSGHEITIIPGKVDLELLGDDESYRWTAVIGFAQFATPADECGILGHADCLKYFLAAFDGHSQVVELAPRPNFPTLAQAPDIR